MRSSDWVDTTHPFRYMSRNFPIPKQRAKTSRHCTLVLNVKAFSDLCQSQFLPRTSFGYARSEFGRCDCLILSRSCQCGSLVIRVRDSHTKQFAASKLVTGQTYQNVPSWLVNCDISWVEHFIGRSGYPEYRNHCLCPAEPPHKLTCGNVLGVRYKTLGPEDLICPCTLRQLHLQSIQMTGQQTADSPPVKLVRSFAEGLARGDVDLVANQLHKDLRRIYHPRSLGQPEQTKEEYILHLTELFKLWPNGSQASHICS